MQEYEPGDRVRIDIPDESDPDHDTYHGTHGTIIEVSEDDAGSYSGDTRDALLYRVELNTGTTQDFRWRDLRPPIE